MSKQLLIYGKHVVFKFIQLLFVGCLIVLLNGFSTHLQAAEMIVSGAASLTNAFTELKTVFAKKHANLTVHLNFAASNPLLKQMQSGAPVDVFASADQETMDKAQESQVIDKSTRKNFAANTLVLITPKGKTEFQLKELNKAQKIAVGNPESVPAGRYAKQSLSAVWDSLASKFVYGANVRQVLDYVARGEVDCGIVYGTDALQQKEKVTITQTLTNHKPILYPIAVATTGKNPKAGQAFIDFVMSKEAQDILHKYGFMQP